MSTADQHLTAFRSGALGTQIFGAVAVLVSAWYLFFQDWSPMQRLRLQSPITFVQDQPAVSLAAVVAGGGPDSIRIQTTAPTAFDLEAVARHEQIELSNSDRERDGDRQAYIKRYAATAVAEMKAYGVPASITIAQGLLETNAGNSALARKNNNHFGIKCFSKKCKKGHCSNFTDDTHKDFFVKYPSAWASYRAHSKFLRSGRYARIEGSYTDWAHGLKKAGYATAPDYAQSLIRLIRLYGLDRLDKM